MKGTIAAKVKLIPAMNKNWMKINIGNSNNQDRWKPGPITTKAKSRILKTTRNGKILAIIEVNGKTYFGIYTWYIRGIFCWMELIDALIELANHFHTTRPINRNGA